MKRIAALSGILVLLFAATLAEAGARSTRPGRAGGSGSGGASGRTHAQGQATWRHAPSGHVGFGLRHAHVGWYGWGGYGWYGWGWPGWYGVPYPGPYLYGVPYGAYGVDEHAPAVVVTGVRPRRATVRLDGEEIGRAKDFDGAWDVLRLEPGRHLLEFSKDGYQTLQVHLDAQPGRSYDIRHALREGEGIDPRSNEAPAVEVAPAREPDPVERSDTAAPRTRGLLRIEVLPGDAAVYLDGEFLGRAAELSALRGAIPTATGVHRVEVVRPGRRSEVREVEVTGGEPARVEIMLEPDEDD